MNYKEHFIEFLCASGALTFGDFVTKSGRKTPYFVNTGLFRTGDSISQLGSFYARHIVSLTDVSFDVLFGPAYKGIPLVVSTAIALSRDCQRNVPFAFDRKEVKTHGDGGRFVGHQFKGGERVILVEDVITAGTTIREMVPTLGSVNASIATVVISVDRCERGTGGVTAVQEVQENLGVRVSPIVTIHDIVRTLETGLASKIGVSAAQINAIHEYLKTYGA